MKNIICRTNTVYTKYVVDLSDLDAIKEILADFYRDGFNIDSDPDLRDRFVNVTMPAWAKSNQFDIDAFVANQGAITGESIRTMHLNDTNQCIAIGIVTVQDLVCYHRYRAIHPDFRGQGYLYESRWNGLAFCFDYAGYNALVGEMPKDVPLPSFMEYTRLDDKQSFGRGALEHYNVVHYTKEQYQAAKQNPTSQYHNYTYEFEEVY